MTPKFVGTLILIMVAACFITGIIAYPALPLHAVSHWNAAGQPNGSMNRGWFAFLLPAIMLVLYGVWAILPSMDPLDGVKRFRYVYDFLFFLIVAFLAYVYAFTLLANLDASVDFRQMIMAGLGVFFVCIGTLLPYTKRNWVAGIRTPWSLSSESNWDKTHKFGGRLFVLAGVLTLIGAFAAPSLGLGLMLGSLFVAMIASVVYSYVLYKRERR